MVALNCLNIKPFTVGDISLYNKKSVKHKDNRTAATDNRFTLRTYDLHGGTASVLFSSFANLRAPRK